MCLFEWMLYSRKFAERSHVRYREQPYAFHLNQTTLLEMTESAANNFTGGSHAAGQFRLAHREFDDATRAMIDSSLLGDAEEVLSNSLIHVPQRKCFDEFGVMTHFVGEDLGHAPEHFCVLAAEFVHVSRFDV